MSYYRLYHNYEEGNNYVFRSSSEKEEIENLVALFQFRFEELADIHQTIGTSDMGRLLSNFIKVEPLDCKLEDVKNWENIDAYVCREERCGEKHYSWYLNCCKEVDMEKLDRFLLLSESYQDWVEE